MADKLSRRQFSVAYDGSDTEYEHSISVDSLGPALLGFGKLIREANTLANGRKTKVNVLVVSDFEHACFNINFELILPYFEKVRSLIGTSEAKDAKELLEWLGLIGGAFVTGSSATLGFLKFLEWRRGRQITQVREVTDTDGGGMVQVRVSGESSPVYITNNTWHLANSAPALSAVRDALAPVGTQGFDRLVVRDEGSVENVILDGQVDDIINSCVAGIDDPKSEQPRVDITTAWLTVYSPVYEEEANQWRFKLGRDVVYVDISDTTIARDAMLRGGAMVDDTYQVRLEITVPLDSRRRPKKPKYKVLEVLRFVPAVHDGRGTHEIGDE